MASYYVKSEAQGHFRVRDDAAPPLFDDDGHPLSRGSVVDVGPVRPTAAAGLIKSRVLNEPRKLGGIATGRVPLLCVVGFVVAAFIATTTALTPRERPGVAANGGPAADDGGRSGSSVSSGGRLTGDSSSRRFFPKASVRLEGQSYMHT